MDIDIIGKLNDGTLFTCKNLFGSFSGGYKFKINYSKDKMRHGMQVHILLNNLASFPLQHNRKAVKFYPEIFEFKVFVESNN